MSMANTNPVRGRKDKFTPSKRIGEQYSNEQIAVLTIVNYNGKDKYNVVFEDSGVMVKNVSYSKIITGKIYDPTINEPGLNGFLGVGKYKKIKRGKVTKAYKEWLILIENYQVDSWMNFQNFANWFYSNYDPKTMKSWILTNVLDYKVVIGDKKRSLYYSEEACTFLPKILVNTILSTEREFIGHSKESKNFSIKLKQFANKQKVGGFSTYEKAREFFYNKKRDYTIELLNTHKLVLSSKIYETIAKNADMQLEANILKEVKEEAFTPVDTSGEIA